MKQFRRAAVAAFVLACSSTAFSQTPQPAETATAAPAVQIEEKKVDQFAAAFVAVQDIQAKTARQLDTATSEQQATQVKAEAEKQMIAAVEREGLQVEEFNQIAGLLSTDVALRTKVVEKVEKRRKG